MKCQFVTAPLKLSYKMTMETHKPREESSVRRSSLEPLQLGKVPRPAEQPGYRLEVSKSNNFVGHSAHHGSSEIYSPAVDIEEGLVVHERKAKTDTTFYLVTALRNNKPTSI